MQRALGIVAVTLAATSCAHIAALDPDALWKIVGGQCVPQEEAMGRPGQCTLVNLSEHYAILKDISGVTQHLLIPTDRITGIESPAILTPNAPDYWVDGWNERKVVSDSLGEPLADNQFGLEINSKYRRTQQQLHIHMDCMRADVTQTLAAFRHAPPGTWQWDTLDGARYRIMRVTSLTQNDNPFRIVARDHPDAQAMATQTILVTGAGPSTAQDGWLVVNSGMDVDGGSGTAEGLLDHKCRLFEAH
ncbi:CDP-diacylglycerol diphosphatase [Paraburkholderia sp. DHOC27]|uniref:CDP-diacylglycerol diphosphatase n=1 Tax=Paraburkholderia sp. DHOC27 TaxID=2303330 RepID=UPI000E3E03EA|nr:CDP-diacylglycerol diphosphatase [Paraburkholderia sp. DHOC27]RFU44839.1 CDP-diacylglycerol diphosphatase [Paraburkholderia sp. DHOC27]